MHVSIAQAATHLWVDPDLSQAEYAAVSCSLLERGDITILSKILVFAERHRDFWSTEAGQEILIGMMQLLIDELDAGEMDSALAMMDVCPPFLAVQAHDLLLQAFFADGVMGDPAELDDAVLLTFVLLLAASDRRDALMPLVEACKRGRVSSSFLVALNGILDHFRLQPGRDEAFKAKLIIWDLDDTLWDGTLADGDEPVLQQARVDYVRAFNRHGIVSAICSKNDFATAKARLEAFGLWDEFVFPRIAFVPKGAVIRQMIADMQLRPVNVLFIDDNPHNLHEVADAVPGIRTMDATSPDCDRLLQQILEDNAHVTKSRVADYRLIETKVAEREDNALSDEAFLMQSDIHATFTDRMDNLEFAERMEELINRSNQLNYTQSRAEPGSLRARILDIDNYVVLSAFVWDKYGYYGLVGVAVLNFRTLALEHFAFSCRIMHMGVEDAMIRKLAEFGHLVDAAQLRKPLPPQSARAIRMVYYHDSAVRDRVLAEEAPRDWSKVRLRLMADCQSGAFHHYSRFREDYEFDNAPRLFSLPMLKTGEVEGQHFPEYLVYAAAGDYVDWRWKKLTPKVEHDVFRDCVDRFEAMILAGNHKCLIFLPPQGLSIENYWLHKGCEAERARDNHPVFNDLWRALARRNPDHVTLVELGEMLKSEDLVHAHNYVPSALQRIAGMIDDWYEVQSRGATRIAA